MPVSSWDLVPSNNNAAPPNGWPEGMLPSDVNNVGRQMMADIRALYDDTRLKSSTQDLFANGTVAAPSVAFTNDPDCGFYRIGANNVGLAINGVKVADVGAATINFVVANLQQNGVQLSTDRIIRVAKTAAESSSATTFHSDALLTVTLEANTYYEVEAFIVVTSAFNGSVSFQMLESQTHVVSALWCHAFLDGGGNVTTGGGPDAGGTTTGTQAVVVTTLNTALVYIKGFVLTNASNAPTYTVQWKNGTASSATVGKGSYLKLTKLQ